MVSIQTQFIIKSGLWYYTSGNHISGNCIIGNCVSVNFISGNHTNAKHTNAKHTMGNHRSENHASGNHTSGHYKSGDHTSWDHAMETPLLKTPFVEIVLVGDYHIIFIHYFPSLLHCGWEVAKHCGSRMDAALVICFQKAAPSFCRFLSIKEILPQQMWPIRPCDKVFLH